MIDQADKLRQLVRETIKHNPALEPGVPIVAVSGGCREVGTSTVAIRLAEELTRFGKRIVLVDGNLLHPSLSHSLEVTTHSGIAEILNGTRSAVEVLEPVTQGLQLIAGSPIGGDLPDMNIRALRRLVTELRALHNHVDLIVLDAGNGMSPWVERMWTAAIQILLVTTPDTSSVRDAYTAVKMAPWGDVDGKLRLVINQADDAALAARIGEGFSSTCRQFLNMKLVGAAAQVAGQGTNAYRQSLRLLAADVLSQTCVFEHHVPAGHHSNYARTSQAAALLAATQTET
jgi:flagellar biosynthesis protein FlhG